jgi:hypothetical protein
MASSLRYPRAWKEARILAQGTSACMTEFGLTLIDIDFIRQRRTTCQCALLDSKTSCLSVLVDHCDYTSSVRKPC